MKLIARTVCLAIFLINSTFGRISRFPDRPKLHSQPIVGDPGEPLILTQLLQENSIEEAQRAALVNDTIFGDVISYSGFFTVDPEFDSNLFFWFFPAFEDFENAPVLLWLQGGPGATSMFGLFQENGPFYLKSGEELGFLDTTWVKSHSVLYIDSPAGTGFSFTNNGYAENQTKVAEGLYSALQQFFTLFPELRSNDFFITGESYAGKYIPAIGYKILEQNSEAQPEEVINLQGLAIGNGLSDPGYQLAYSDHLYQLGLVDTNGKTKMKIYEEALVSALQDQNYTAASEAIGNIDFVFWEETRFSNMYNLLIENDTNAAILDSYMSQFLSDANIRRSIHVGNVSFDEDPVYYYLELDIPKSVTPWVSTLLSNYPVLIYSGQLDLIVPYTPTVEYLQNLDFSGSDEYKVAQRHKWYVGDDLAGYVKVAGNLTEVMVRNSGHMVPTDQGVWALDLITKFTRKQTIYNDES